MIRISIAKQILYHRNIAGAGEQRRLWHLQWRFRAFKLLYFWMDIYFLSLLVGLKLK